MEQQTSIQTMRKRKFLLLLPLFFIPVAACIFYGLGGGRTGKQDQAFTKGINVSLPGATFDKGQVPEDKMSLYEKQKRDSINARQKDASGLIAGMGFDTGRINQPDESVSRINEKLAQIKQEVGRPVANSSYSAGGGGADAQTKKLQQMVETMKHPGNTEDPEMKQLDGLMNKLLQLQHPELVKAQVKRDTKPVFDSTYKAIRAEIDGTQKVVQGASVKLRLVDTLIIKGQIIPKGSILYGSCQINNQRLLLPIKTIRLGTSIVPVDLSVYDLDAMEGIKAPSAITEDAVRSGSDNALQSMQLLSMDQSLGTQAASAGIQAAKSLFSKKVKVIKVKLKAGYPVLLRINKN